MKFTPSQDPRIAINLKLSEIISLKGLILRIKPASLPRNMMNDLIETIGMLDDAQNTLIDSITE
jgi:hypothetical protein